MSKILTAREERAKHISELMKHYPNKTIAILKTNVVGEDKNPLHFKFICAYYKVLINEQFRSKILLQGHQISDDGNYCFFVIDEVGTMVKVRTMAIEESTPLGRLIDIDVYHKKSISRKDLKCEMRQCIICDKYAHICARNQTHSKEEIHTKMKTIIDEFLVEYITKVTIQAMYSELELYPKFGLVSHKDSGCHKDMDYDTFIKSTLSLQKYIKEYINTGLQESYNPLDLKKIGLRAEKRMFKATRNINTHKGLVFLLGIFLPALSTTITKNETVRFLQEEISRISEVIIGDYYDQIQQKETLTHGDVIFQETGLKGVRGEALRGLGIVLGAPSYQNEFDENVKYHDYLLYFMSKLNDTTVIHKTDMDTLRKIQSEISDIVQNGGYNNNVQKVATLSEEYKKKCISPGGSADLLVIKIIFEELKHLIA